MKISHLAAIAAVVLLSSCSTTKDNTLAYFRNIENSKSGEMPSTLADYAVRIQPDDELVITVTSTVPEATAIYNLPLSNPARLSELTYTSQPKQQTYVVDGTGNITFPVLGSIAVQGKTTREVEDMLIMTVVEEDEEGNRYLVGFNIACDHDERGGAAYDLGAMLTMHIEQDSKKRLG